MSTALGTKHNEHGFNVILALMPKGVEHRMDDRAWGNYKSVILALMPKGVEHEAQTLMERRQERDPRVDAERR